MRFLILYNNTVMKEFDARDLQEARQEAVHIAKTRGIQVKLANVIRVMTPVPREIPLPDVTETTP